MERSGRDDIPWMGGDLPSPYSSSSSFNNLRGLPENAAGAAVPPMAEANPLYSSWLFEQYHQLQQEAANPFNPYSVPQSPIRNSSYQDQTIRDLAANMGGLHISRLSDQDASPLWNDDKVPMSPQYDEAARRQRLLEQMYRQQMGMYMLPNEDSNALLNPYLYNNNLQSGRTLLGSAYSNNNSLQNGGNLLSRSANRYPAVSQLNQNQNGYGLDQDFGGYSGGGGSGSSSLLRASDINLRRRSNNNPRSRTSQNSSSMMSLYNNNNGGSSSSLLGGGGGSNRLLGSLSSLSSLEELKGNIVEVACNKQLSQLLLKKFEEGTPEEVDVIFLEVKDNLLGLMDNQLEKLLIDGFFRLCNEEQIYQVLIVVVSDDDRLEKICVTGHGTRRMQELLQNVTTQEHKDIIIPALAKITMPLTVNDCGHHVILKCLGLFNPEENNHLFGVVTKNFFDIATDKSGCCVIQQCVEKAKGEAKQRLIAEVITNAPVLSEHPYGNYVVQYILGLEVPHVTQELLNQLEGNLVALSMNKYGSNVVEACLRKASEDQVARIIKEITDSQYALMVFQNAFGNYVAQCAIDRAKGAIRHTMQELVLSHSHNLHSHPHGKRVLAKFKPSRPRGY